MINKNKLVAPVILGGDLGAYSMARAFAETAGVISYVFARERLAICDSSAFTELTVVKNLDDPNVATELLIEFASAHKEKALIIIPTSDWYMEVLQYSREVLEKYYFFYIPDFELWRALTDKSSFYSLLSANGISYPETVVLSPDKLNSFGKIIAKIKPPYVLKPADSSMYWRNYFKGMQKVYFPLTLEEAEAITKMIYASGYTGKIIVQERILRIDSDGIYHDPDSSVLTTYSNREGRVVRAVLGDVLLEEQGPTSRGNYSSILTRPLDSFSKKLISFLNGFGYVGIANFEILTVGDKKYCLELNARSGRSSDYVRAAGVNLAGMLIKDMSGIFTDENFDYDEILWTAAPIKCLNGNCVNERFIKRAQSIFEKRRYSSPFDSQLDNGLFRKLYLMLHERRQIVLFERQGKEALRCSLKRL